MTGTLLIKDDKYKYIRKKEFTNFIYPPLNECHLLLKTKTCFIWIFFFQSNLTKESFNHQFSSVQSLSLVWLFATPWTVACKASLSINNSWSLPKLMSIELVMPSNYLILCRPLLLLPPIPPSIRVFSNKSTLRMRWPKYWSFSFSISPSNEHPDWSPLG